MSSSKKKMRRISPEALQEEPEEEEELSPEEKQYRDPKIWAPEDFGVVTQGTTMRDFLTVRDKVVFNSTKKPMDTSQFEATYRTLNGKSTGEGIVTDPVRAAGRQPDMNKFRCLPTAQTFRTIPDSSKYNTRTKCPPYTKYAKNTGCCILRKENIFDMRGYSEPREFLYSLFDCIKHVENKHVAQQTFGADLMEWYRTNKIGFATYNTTLKFYNGSRFRDIFLQFLFRAIPTIKVKLDLDHPLAQPADGILTIYDVSKRSWVLTSGKKDTEHFVNLMRKTGVDGAVTYTYERNIIPVQPIHMRCSTMIHQTSDFMDVTHVDKLFASDDCGFNGEKNIFVKSIGVLSKKETTFDDFLVRLMKSMPDFDCKFSMLVEDGSSGQGWRSVDTLYQRVLPFHHNFTQGSPYISDVMKPILEKISKALPRGHGTHVRMGTHAKIATGGAVGSWTETLYDSRKRGTGDYFFILKVEYKSRNANGDRTDPTFTLQKFMLTTIH